MDVASLIEQWETLISKSRAKKQDVDEIYMTYRQVLVDIDKAKNILLISDEERFESITRIFGLSEEPQSPIPVVRQFKLLRTTIETAVQAKAIVVEDGVSVISARAG
ncbi:hypothetical protein Loa_01838 [Legionella oakridgensis ATCC 33761 = DSM 21215]|uniref:Uncharacterized protein n=3 Tax=Legionella oakridgensis TaxID=29423 RepID=W0BC17_9GAMM|nr:hypothetical protein Loa_01838 [Legionella oakridgensis ATCC 33761 = DSM 21215]ETO93045.1 hypothetical protein LOR_68c19230 [Legionella oakridgensis RV-2-2007]KTD43453.1 hypothetical protein Loak_0628 [Legionella oakridgensis]STY20444.1 Uncharacterised protein [Legionella longbeachae]